MSAGLPPQPQSEPVAGGVIAAAPWRNLLPWLALFVRLAIGLSLLNIGLAAVMASMASPFGGPGPWNGGWNAGPPGFPGLGLLAGLLPYAALAVGAGLVFGIFTTAAALLACGLVLLPAILLTLEIVTVGNIMSPNGMIPFGRGLGPDALIGLLGLGVVATPSLVALVLLSPTSINRFSIDALIFRRVSAPTFAAPAAPGPAGSAGLGGGVETEAGWGSAPEGPAS